MNRNRHFQSMRASMALSLVLLCASVGTANAFTPSDVPLANVDVALSNVALTISAEFPTADTSSYGVIGTVGNPDTRVYVSTETYYGYFDPTKCYTYVTASPVTNSNTYFEPTTCSSTTPRGNFLNWASMSVIDQFRQTMTGGLRLVDTATTTVLQRSFMDALPSRVSDTGVVSTDINSPNRVATTTHAGNLGVVAGTAQAGQYIYKISGMGDKMLVMSGSTMSWGTSTAAQRALQDCKTLQTTMGSTTPMCYHIRVKVCNSATNKESNCTLYGSNYKPEGLMQKYNQNMRFAAFGYLADYSKTQNQQGGVLRARMKSVGPTITNALGVSTANTNKEWDPNTGIFDDDPDKADSIASSTLSGITISNSGVMNYLNKFGQAANTTSGYAYKYYDPMAELFYDSVRYLRGLPYNAKAMTYATSSYAQRFDGFPAIAYAGKNTADDPVVNACQKNFIIAIGDKNNQSCDTRVPGGTTSGCPTGSALPTGDTTNFATPANYIQTLDTQASGLKWMGGIAYWAHTNDIRPDLAANRPSNTIQDITTYMIDVMENHNYDGTTKTQLWMTAKYGGFDKTLTAVGTPNNPNTFLTGSSVKSWDKNADNVPDNWFAGNDPLKIRTALAQVFDKIAAAGTTGNGGAAGASGVSLATAKKIYYAGYSMENNGRGWLKSCAFAISAADCTGAHLDWDASQWLSPSPVPSAQYTAYQSDAADASTTPPTTKRAIITRSGGAGVEFTFTNLASGDQANLAYDPSTQIADTDSTLAGKRVSYLRGSSANEIANGGPFRSRTATKLGDIIGSGPVYVGAPNALYSGALFTGYSAFLTAHASRNPVVYVGANDGMLHAFQASDGKELLAYVPGYFLQHDSGKSAARISALTDPTYKHKFFVDATPMVGDVYNGSTWKSILLGAYGAGGKGFYALDVTDPSSLTAANASTISLWEKSDSDDTDIGYTFNQPVFSAISGQSLQFGLIPTTSGRAWAIIVGNGFGSTNGKAALLFLNPTTGTTLAKVVVESATAANGLATPFPVDTDGDGLIDTIWAGDLQGTMWRIRWDNTSSAWVSTALYRGGSTQPITSAPFAAPHCSISGAWNVVFGTGKYSENSDYNTKTQQTLYGMLDTLTSTIISPATALIAKTDLVAQTYSDGTAGSDGLFDRTFSTNPVDYASKKGWYIDLHTTNGERSISNPVIPADTGIALLGSFEPPTACMPITGVLNVVNACTGGGAYDPVTGNAVKGVGGEGLGIPYISTPVSSGSTTVTPFGNGAPLPTPGGPSTDPCVSSMCLDKAFTSGVRASWRELR